MPSILVLLFSLLFAYLVGSLSGSLLLGRLRGVDIRTQGSGNAGGSNAFRTQGAGFGGAVAAFDLAKGGLVAWLVLHHAPLPLDASVDATALAYAAVVCAAIGHVWPVWHGFRGGKGAATLAGGILVLWPWVAPVLLLAWIAVVVLSGYVGLATVTTGLLLAAIAWLGDAAVERQVFASAAALLLVFTHRGNLARLRGGGEARFERARLLHRLWRQA